MKHEEVMGTPILQKSMNMVNTILALKKHVDIKNEVSCDTMDQIVQDVMAIPPKLATAMAVGRHDLQLENATIAQQSSNKIIALADPFWGVSKQIDAYLYQIQEEIVQLKLLLDEWVEGLNN